MRYLVQSLNGHEWNDLSILSEEGRSAYEELRSEGKLTHTVSFKIVRNRGLIKFHHGEEKEKESHDHTVG